ncbi:MAG: AzlD domain-containing protein [Acidimicrobiales bacterium]|nr:AzlD domain-containing protein [Acidimicrobiales bacterium]
MTTVLAFSIAALVTFALRSSMTLAGARRAAALQTGIGLVTPAVLAAMVATALFVDHGAVAAPPVAELAAVGTALVVARRKNNASVALAAGLPVYWALSALGS